MLTFFKNLSASAKGIIFINFAVFGFSYSNAFVKEIGERLDASEVLFYRSIFFFVPFLGFLLLKKGLRGTCQVFHTPRPGLEILRALFGAIGLWLIFYGFTVLPLAESSALNFSGTLFVTVLAGPILKEYIGIKRWLAVLVGFLGILLIAQPTSEGLAYLSLIGTGAAIFGAFFDSINLVCNRLLSRWDSDLTIFTYYTTVMMVFSTGLFFFTPMTPLNWQDFLLLLGVSSGSAFGQYMVTKAFSHAEASLIAPFIYMLMAWGILFGYIFWGEMPTEPVILGTAIVILIGIFVAKTSGNKNKGTPKDEIKSIS